MSEPPTVAGGLRYLSKNIIRKAKVTISELQPPATAGGSDLLIQILPIVLFPRKAKVAVFDLAARGTGADKLSFGTGE